MNHSRADEPFTNAQRDAVLTLGSHNTRYLVPRSARVRTIHKNSAWPTRNSSPGHHCRCDSLTLLSFLRRITRVEPMPIIWVRRCIEPTAVEPFRLSELEHSRTAIISRKVTNIWVIARWVAGVGAHRGEEQRANRSR